MIWLIVVAVIVVLIALAWWTSGRTRRGVDTTKVDRVRGEGNRQAGDYDRPPGGGPTF